MKNSVIIEKINLFRNKFYLNLIIKGILLSIFFSINGFLLIVFLEHLVWFDSKFRQFIFWGFCISSLIFIIYNIIIPFLKIYSFGNIISNKQAANIIGEYFRDIDDKLLNLLELEEINDKHSDLLIASINQKTEHLNKFKFEDVINFSSNKKYLKLLIIPTAIIILIFITGNNQIISESSARVINYNETFTKPAPFKFILKNKTLDLIENQKLKVLLELKGSNLPNEVFIRIADRDLLMSKAESSDFYSYEFYNIKESFNFNFYSNGFTSKKYKIEVKKRPLMLDYMINFSYPKHTFKKDDSQKNIGEIFVPEGTKTKWSFKTKNVDELIFALDNEIESKSFNNDDFEIQKTLMNSGNYKLKLVNKNGVTDSNYYSIRLLKDEYPKINVEVNFDSTNNLFVYNGSAFDDYQISDIKIKYLKNEKIINETSFKTNKQREEFFDYEINTNNISEFEYDKLYFEVWDNDGVNGFKSAKTEVFSLNSISKTDAISNRNQKNNELKSTMQSSFETIKEMNEEIEKIKRSLINNKRLDWNQKENVKDLLKKQMKLENEIQKSKNLLNDLIEKNEILSPEIIEKQKLLNEMMEKVFDEELLKMIDEMQKDFENLNKEEIQKLLENLEDQNLNIEEELDREIELFKQMEIEQRLSELKEKIKEIKSKQDSLTNDKNIDQNTLEKQNDIKKEFDELKKDIDEMQNLNDSLENPNNFENTEELEKKIDESIEESIKKMKLGNKKSSKKSQKNTSDKMQDLEDQLSMMLSSCKGNQNFENLETLRQILDNLISISFSQEELILKTKETNKNSSEFIQIIRTQKKIKDDSEIVKDSLLALSKRVIEIESIVNKEINKINSYLSKSINSLEDRDIRKANISQQFVMTSVNNLALLLDESLKQMQKQLASQTPGNKQCNNPGSGPPSLSQLKQMQKKLLEEMKNGENGKNGSKSLGESLSKKLMQLAQLQQEAKENLLKMRDELGNGKNKGDIDKLLDDMEKNNDDIIFNKISQKTIDRQNKILSRLLDFDEAEREQGEDDKRESLEWIMKNEIETIDEEISRQKKKNISEEILKRNNVKLNPFYKRINTDYFNKISKDD